MRPRQARSPRKFRGLLNIYPGDVLLFHTVASAVPSALKGLTSVFGMGTGVTPPLWSPGSSNQRKLYTTESLKSELESETEAEAAEPYSAALNERAVGGVVARGAGERDGRPGSLRSRTPFGIRPFPLVQLGRLRAPFGPDIPGGHPRRVLRVRIGADRASDRFGSRAEIDPVKQKPVHVEVVVVILGVGSQYSVGARVGFVPRTGVADGAEVREPTVGIGIFERTWRVNIQDAVILAGTVGRVVDETVLVF